METYDLVIVGAGWYGLAAAKACSQILPLENMAILEAAESCGGTWSKDRLYPGLKSNNMAGTYEYPDFSMTQEKYGVEPDSHIPGATLHQYLTDFAHHFGFYDQIQFHTKVDVVKSIGEDGWDLHVTGPQGQRTIRAAKLVLATGLTSTPNMPEYEGAETFGAPLFHAKDFCKEAPKLDRVKNTVVVGGAKSAFDVAYAMVDCGSTVDLVIKDNGHGPVWITPPFVTPFKKRIDQLLLIRWMTWFSPCPWGSEDGFGGIRAFLHRTAIGRWFVDLFWSILASDVIRSNGYDSHSELKKLKPWNSAFWIGSGLSILNYDRSLFDLVKKGKIRVHVGQIDHLAPNKVILEDGTVLETDLMVCSTGWKKESTIRFEGLGVSGFGLPCTVDELKELNKKTNENVLNMFPRLKNQPELRFKPKQAEPLRFYRFIVPISEVFKHKIAFSGAVSTVNTATCATIQGHWIAAYLLDKLDRAPTTPQDALDEIMLHTQWGRWRFPCGYGASLPDFVFEGLPYVDMLLKDLGINSHRKKGWFSELTSPYLPRDFAGLVEEWNSKHSVPSEIRSNSLNKIY